VADQAWVDTLGGPLDRASPTPIFEQIRTRVQDAISSGDFAAHQRIPSERQLSDRFGVSRMTVRQALEALAQERFLYSLPGKGTFVADQKIIEQPLLHLTSFTQDILARGMQPSSRLLDGRIVAASFEMARLFGVSPTVEIVQVTRLRLGDGEPLAIETTHIPSALAPGLLAHDLAGESLYAILAREYGIRLASARQTIEAAEPTPDEQRALGIDGPRPVLRISRLTSDASNRVVEYVRSVYRGDRYHLTVELR
jgi:GntR family transcriptional regulator, N-acetylglucosamine utilization regulator